MKKSRFSQTSLRFRGHIVSAEGIWAEPEKTNAVEAFPIPTDLKAVQRFLGMAGWYHRFVPNFSQVADPLNVLKRKGAHFQWTPACQHAFETLKGHLVSSPILGHPDFDLPFVVYTDASDVGLGAVLVQQVGLGNEEIWRAQQKDPETQKLYQSILDGGELTVNDTTKFSILEDKVYRVVQLPYKQIYQVYIPECLREPLLEMLHEDPISGHLGRYKTYKRLQALVYWPGMGLEVKDYV